MSVPKAELCFYEFRFFGIRRTKIYWRAWLFEGGGGGGLIPTYQGTGYAISWCTFSLEKNWVYFLALSKYLGLVFSL